MSNTNDTQLGNTSTRRGDGGSYLVIADGAKEFNIAAYYAAKIALARRGSVSIAHITNLHDFMHWGKVEALMLQDLRLQAEKDLWQAAKEIHEDHGIFPCLYIQEGQFIEKIVDIIEENKNIRALILAGSTNSNNQGPLVSYFTGKGMNRLRIPLIIVPGHLDKEAIDAIT